MHPPGPDALRAGLARQLAAVPDDDPEYQIEALCIFRQINTLRVAASDITNVLPLMKVSDHLSWIAETILDKVVEISWNNLVARHGRPSCTLDGQTCKRGFAVIGYGKLGASSWDTDRTWTWFFSTRPTPAKPSAASGPSTIPIFLPGWDSGWFICCQPTRPPARLYETDMRLRPNGASGLLVSHVNGFKRYQMDEAWTWEHQALIRARPIVGDSALKDAFCRDSAPGALPGPGAGTLKASVREMREAHA
jgi:glutamate-ammonia-ligase adenylyltransferase